MQKRRLLSETAHSLLSQVMQVGSRVQAFSQETLEKAPRIRDARVVHSVCPYCAVGCSQNVYVKDGKVIDIEGNPDSPINRGKLCPKGAATFQYTVNPSRLTQVLYRAPYSDHWEVKSLDWAMEQIAQRVKMTRDETFVERLPDGREVNHTLGIASLGGATLDVEENYLTNAAMLIRKDYQDTEDLNGLFSGYDPETGTYADQSSWEYQYDEQGRPLTDPTLQHPQCVFQIMRRHFARYTPEMVEHVCGVSQEQFQLVVQTIIENSGRERTTALCYAVGWTQQSKGVQIIRAGAIIQLLLGNVGRPGGGIQALRGHACIQGATDIPTLYDLLSGYMPQPGALLSAQPRAEDVATHMTWGVKTDAPSNAQSQQTLQEYIDSTGEKLGWWSNIPAYMKSLLKAWYGEAVNDPESDSGYRWIPIIIDLGKPERFLHMLRVFKVKSPMSMGTWGVVSFSMFCSASVVTQAASDGLLGRWWGARLLAALPQRLIALLGIPFGIFLGSYTGVLLAATSNPLWSRSRLLGAVFISSAFSTSTALITLILHIIRAPASTLHKLDRLEWVAILVELTGILTFLRNSGRAARPLVGTAPKEQGTAFWSFVFGSGLLLPWLMKTLSMFSRRSHGIMIGVLPSLLVLVGGYFLRRTIVEAGHTSSQDARTTLWNAKRNGRVFMSDQ